MPVEVRSFRHFAHAEAALQARLRLELGAQVAAHVLELPRDALLPSVVALKCIFAAFRLIFALEPFSIGRHATHRRAAMHLLGSSNRSQVKRRLAKFPL